MQHIPFSPNTFFFNAFGVQYDTVCYTYIDFFWQFIWIHGGGGQKPKKNNKDKLDITKAEVHSSMS